MVNGVGILATTAYPTTRRITKQNELQQGCLHDTESNMAGADTYCNHNGRYETASKLSLLARELVVA